MVQYRENSRWWPSLTEPLRQFGARVAEWFAPASEAARTDESYVIHLELPGVAVEDVDITVKEGVLTVKGEKKVVREEKGADFFFSERQYGLFQRSFTLPEDADTDRIEAEMKDGVLTIVIPKTKPAADEGTRVKIRRAE